jgi:hypothetical protein
MGQVRGVDHATQGFGGVFLGFDFVEGARAVFLDPRLHARRGGLSGFGLGA